jgi:outer membrane lipoprotein-sorting protein
MKPAIELGWTARTIQNRRPEMKKTRLLIAAALLLALLPVYGAAQTETADPYEILARHYDAIGGLEKFEAESTSYFEGTISIFGMEGTIKQWEHPPYRQRQELSLPVFSYVTGDNGEYAWVVDQNGKLQIQKDEQTLKKREVEALMSAYDFMDPDSDVFTVTYEGIEPVNGEDCYVVKIANNINENVRKLYIRKSDYYEVKSDVIEPDHEMDTVFSDFRDIDGRMIAFRHEIEILPIGQSQVVQITKYESNIEIDPAVFEPPQAGAEDFHFTQGNSSENITFEYLGDHIFLDVTMDCDKRRWCLDSGAGATVIDSAYAAELGLESQGETKGYGAGKTVAVAFVDLPAYSVTGIDFEPQKGASLPISGLFKKSGIDVAGILGYDFLSRFVTRVDFANKLISFYDPDDFTYGGTGRIVDAPLKENLFHLPMTVDGKYTGDWALDIGASGAGFSYPFAKENGLLDMKGVEALAGGAGGYSGTKVVEFATVDLAGFELTDQLLSMPLEGGGVLGMREGIGLLGNNILRHFVLYLDYDRQQVIFEKGGDFAKDFPRGKTGLGVLVNDDGKFKVIFVSPGTPAEAAGFKVGDTMTAVNGIAVEHLAGLLALRDLFEADAGTAYTVDITRDGRPLSIDLTLEDLF